MAQEADQTERWRDCSGLIGEKFRARMKFWGATYGAGPIEYDWKYCQDTGELPPESLEE
jgi:hypothetical protein